MRYFKLNDEIFAYDEDQEHLITDDMIEITGSDLDAILNPQLPPIKLAPLTNRQFKLALLDAELIDRVELAISELADPKLKRKIQIEYEYAATFNRNSESISTMIELLEITQEDVDQIWINALTI